MDEWKFIAAALYLLGVFNALHRLSRVSEAEHLEHERQIGNENPDLSMSRRGDYVVRHISMTLYMLLWPFMAFFAMLGATKKWKIKK